MNPSTNRLKALQYGLLQSLGYWNNFGKEPVPAAIHLPHIICLLQSVGFHIRRIDSSPPSDIAPLTDNQKGTRVIVSCGHSGQRFFLELPEDPEKCKCLTANTQDQYWEVTGKNNYLIESGSDIVPRIPPDLNLVLRNVLTLLIHLIQGTSAKENINEVAVPVTAPATSSPNVDAKRLSGFMNELVNPAITITSPDMGSTSKLSNRSPGAVTKSPNQENAGSPLLRTSPVLIKSSPDLLELTRILQEINHQSITKPNPTNKSTVPLNKKAVLSPKQKTFAVDKNKSVSSPNLSTQAKKKTVSPTVVKSSVNKPYGKPQVSKTISTKLPLKNIPIPSNKTPNKVEPKMTTETKNSIGKTRRSSNLYAHVKSTIPKPSPTGRAKKK